MRKPIFPIWQFSSAPGMLHKEGTNATLTDVCVCGTVAVLKQYHGGSFYAPELHYILKRHTVDWYLSSVMCALPGFKCFYKNNL
jgi:hypothetical protein